MSRLQCHHQRENEGDLLSLLRGQARLSPRPAGITALSVFFAAGAAIALTSSVSLLFPGGPLEPMWRLNPRAREAFASWEQGAAVLLAAVSVACGAAAIGLWKGARWGHALALGLLVVNLVGDVTNVVFGIEPRAAVGIPIAGALIVYLIVIRGYRGRET